MMIAIALIVIGSACSGALIAVLLLAKHGADNSAEEFLKTRNTEVPKEISR
jgi:hypothetical protein